VKGVIYQPFLRRHPGCGPHDRPGAKPVREVTFFATTKATARFSTIPILSQFEAEAGILGQAPMKESDSPPALPRNEAYGRDARQGAVGRHAAQYVGDHSDGRHASICDRLGQYPGK
jgi:hypothetical protein